MARTKTYQTKELIAWLNEYKIENPGIKVTIPKFGVYLRSKGKDIQDHTLRRDEEFREYLQNSNDEENSKNFNDLVTYKTIDVDSFMEKNNNKGKLREALINRDRYYANVAAKGAEAIKEKKECQAKIKEMNIQIEELKNVIKETEKKLIEEKEKNTDTKIKEKDKAIVAMKNILDDYIYPDMANAILKRDGVLKVVNSVVDNDVVDEKSICANTDIENLGKKEQNDNEENKKSEFSSVNSILGGFDD